MFDRLALALVYISMLLLKAIYDFLFFAGFCSCSEAEL